MFLILELGLFKKCSKIKILVWNYDFWSKKCVENMKFLNLENTS